MMESKTAAAMHKSSSSKKLGKSAVKTKTATVSKITKLVLKPKPSTNASLTPKIKTKKYTTKPVTITSRSTTISHESTFHIRSVQKSPSKSQTVKNVNLNTIMSTKRCTALKENEPTIAKSEECAKSDSVADAQQPVQNLENGNIAPLHQLNMIDNPILQEITSNIINESNVRSLPEITLDSSNSGTIFAKDKQRFTSINVKENIATHKKTSADSIRARQFIRLQKEKRKEMEKEKEKMVPSKEEIKRRLTALQKNSLKIVGKNLQKIRKNVNATNEHTKMSSKNENKMKSECFSSCSKLKVF